LATGGRDGKLDPYCQGDPRLPSFFTTAEAEKSHSVAELDPRDAVLSEPEWSRLEYQNSHSHHDH